MSIVGHISLALGVVALCTAPARAQERPSGAEVSRILGKLAKMHCEIAPGNIEKSENGYRLDGALCPSGRYTILLTSDLTVKSRTPS